LPINTESVIATATKTPKFSLRWLLTINFVVYVVLLTARSWGSHRILHYEETIAVASALSQSFFATLNDFAYGLLVPRILIFLAVQLPLEYLPITLLTIATFLWAIFSTIIFWVVYKKTHRYLPAFLASLVLILVPLPELGMQGIVWNSFWPMFIALGVVVACRAYGESTQTTFLAALFAFLTAASNPVAGVLMLLLGFDYICHKALRKKVLVVSVGLFVGMVFSLFVQINQEPPLRYLGEWTQELAQTSETLGRLEDSGAATLRKAPSLDIVAVFKGLPGTIKYLLTQIAPEPIASRWVASSSLGSDVLRIGTLFAVFLILPLGALRLQTCRINESKFKEHGATLRLFLAAALVLVLQIILISGTLQTRQLLFAPICFYWIAIFIISPAVSKLQDLNRSAVPTAILILAIIFALTALQNFRDPFDSNPRQGGMGRYEEDPLWTLALSRALGECQNMQPDDIVIISQKEEIWVDSPVVIRCKFITR
jgi:hypothetical protein